jgi:phosphate/sulfate permease
MAGELLLGLSSVVAFAMLWATGANDVANALGTSVGSKALTFRHALVLGAVFELLGASLVGGNVEATIQEALIDVDGFGDPFRFAVGMFASILGTFLWVTLATLLAIPVSTTHAIVGSVVGFALFEGRGGHVHWAFIGKTAASWVVSPLLGAVLGGALYRLVLHFILKHENRVARAERGLPYLFAVNLATDAVFIVIGGPAMFRPEGFSTWDVVAQVYLPVFLGMLVVGYVLGLGLILPWVKKHANRFHVNSDAIDAPAGSRREELDALELAVTQTSTGGGSAGSEAGADSTGSGRSSRASDLVTRVSEMSLSARLTENERTLLLSSTDTDPLMVVEDIDDVVAAPRPLAAARGGEAAAAVSPAEAMDSKPTAPGYGLAEVFFAPLCIISACAVAMAHGGNDVANALGPLAVVLNYNANGLSEAKPMPSWINVIGGLGIVSGLATLGYKVMQTVGNKITQLSLSKAFSAQFGASVSILTATVIGLPISTTAVLVGCLTGVGMADGFRKDAVDLKLIGRIVLTWIVTLPVAAAVSGCLYLLFRLGT